MNDDQAYKTAITNITKAMRDLMDISRLLHEQKQLVELVTLHASFIGKEATLALPLPVLQNLAALTPLLLYIFEEAPELVETIGAPEAMMQAIAQSPFRPSLREREVLTRLFAQVSGVEA